MLKTDIYLLACLGCSFLAMASLYNNPLSFTTSILIATTLTLIYGFSKELKKE